MSDADRNPGDAGQGFDLVLFGGTGDLAMRKLLPALYYCHRDSAEFEHSRIIAVARSAQTLEAYLAQVREQVQRFLPAGDFSEDAWQRIAARIDYQSVDAAKGSGYDGLGALLARHPERVRVYYLATAPDLFVPICEGLAAAGLVTPLSRIVLEKPLGRDLGTARKIIGQVGAIFDESQIFRIDHYLGKETVQNLLALRFGNMLFEPLWRREWIRDVQITLAEKVGVEGRSEFYDRTGALRDMVQSHLLQLLCIVAMEPPASLDPDAVRDEKLKVLRALKPISGSAVGEFTVRGQYRGGAIDGKVVPGYLEEPGMPAGTQTETFVAIRAELGNWRWAGVPFYLRTGKRMPERLAEIVINFRALPHAILPTGLPLLERSNRLVIRLQPDEGVEMHLLAKAPGDEMRLLPVSLNLDFRESFKGRQWDAYERLLIEVVRGRATLFMRRDELEAAWAWIEPILRGWEALDERPKAYTSGTWGPAASSALIARDDLAWHEEL